MEIIDILVALLALGGVAHRSRRDSGAGLVSTPARLHANGVAGADQRALTPPDTRGCEPRHALPEVVPALSVRPAGLDDFEAVAHLFAAVRGYNATLDLRFALAASWRELLREQFMRTHADPDALWLLAWRGPQPVGLLVVDTHLDSPLLAQRRWAEVQALYVAPDCRGTGLAQRLMAKAQAWAGTRGLDRVQVHAATANEHARGFYRRCGFQPVQEVLRLEVPPQPAALPALDQAA